MKKGPLFLVASSVLLCGSCLCTDLSEDSIITTFAGAAHTFDGDGASALIASLSGFQQLQTDPNGNIIFADTGNQVVSRLNSDGTLTVLAGNGIAGFSGEGGPARSASLRFPSDAVMDRAGNLYIYDSLNFRIRRVTPDGTISTYAGVGINGYTGDGGPATKARIQLSGKMAVDSAGNLYFTDGIDSVIRRVTPDGTISTYAGNGQPASAPNNGDKGPASKASLGLSSGGIAVDSAGNLYVAEDLTNQIRKIAPDGTITTVAGSGVVGFQDGPALNAQFYTPFGIAVDPAGDVFVADVNNGLVRKVAKGVVSSVAGTPVFGFSGDEGPALNATFRFPEGVAVGGDGDLFIEDNGNFRIRSVSSDGIISSVAGNGQFDDTPDGTPAGEAALSGPNFLSFDPAGRLLIADSGNYTVRRVDPDGRIETIAGLGVQGVGQGYQLIYGGPATSTLLGTPRQALADQQGNLYVSDDYASVVYRITPDGNLNVYAGQVGVYQFGGDNVPATSSSFTGPQGLALDAAGNLYIADPGENRVRKVSPNGTITTFAGNGQAGYSGDGGPATQAMLYFPQSIAVDTKGDLIIADRVNNRLRMVTPDGNISTIAGTGTRASDGNGGLAAAADLNRPFVVSTDSSGNIFVIESGGTTVRRISPNGIISVVAGNGESGFGGDGGPATQASLGGADGLATDASGNLYISDFNNSRIRVVLGATPTATASPTSLSFLGSSGGAATDPQAISVNASVPGLQISASTDSPWIQVPASVAYAPGTISVSANPAGLAPGTYQGTVFLRSPGLTAALASVHVTFLVNSATDPKLSSDTPRLTFSLFKGGVPQSQSLRVLNTGSGQVNFFVAVQGAAATGVTTSIQQGTTQPNQPAVISITADPSNLAVGTVTASLLVLGTNLQYLSIPITITVSPTPQKMALSRAGFTFVAVPGGGVTPPQTFDVLNTGAGTFSWSAQASTVSGGSWLSVSPANGSSSPTSFGPATVSANPSGLAPGVYYGVVQVSSAGTVNSPQQLEVVLNVLSPDQPAGATVAPSGFIFTGPYGGFDPSSQTFKVTNLSASDASLSVNVKSNGGDWLVVAPNKGTIPAGKSQIITVQPQTGSLSAGVYQASVALQVGTTPLAVNVVFVVVPAVPVSLAAHDVAPTSCTPTQLYPVFTSLIQGFVIPASWPLPIEVQVVDDCGNSMTSGRVSTTFSNGDAQLSLVSLQNGQWEGVWLARNIRPNQIVITANAATDTPALHGSVPFTGMLASNPNVPSINSGGVVSGAGVSGEASVAPGDVITISGQYFAAVPTSAAQLPLSASLGGTQVLVGGVALPLIYSSSGKILAIIPYNLAPNAQYQVIVSRAGAISGPEPITVGAGQPYILRIDNTNSATLPQSLWTQLTSGMPFSPPTAAPPNPIKAGAQLVIYCTGLGAIDQPLDASMAAPTTPVNAVNPVSVSIGGQKMTVSFAGLAPGYTGLYEITGTAPANLPSGTNVAITITAGGQTSDPVTVPLQ